MLAIFGIIGLTVRIYYFPHGVPIANDGYSSFIYALDMSRTGYFPTGYQSTNTGWANILALVFSIFKFQDPLSYMSVQRFLSIFASVITIIPVYLLCGRFFKKRYAILGAALFVFEPRIIQNSLLGLDYPIFLLLMTTALFLFLSENKKTIYISFIVLSLASIVRYEALLMIGMFLVIFYFRFRNNKKVSLRILLILGICVLILFPIGYIRNQTGISDGLISKVIAGPIIVSDIVNEPNDEQIGHGTRNNLMHFINTSIGSFMSLFGKILVPTFIAFLLLSSFLILKNRRHIKKDEKIITIILFSITSSLPALYAYGREILESRYLFILFPTLCILSIYSINYIRRQYKKDGKIVVIIIGIVLVSSLVFLENEKINYDYEIELFLTAKQLFGIANAVNDYPRAGYFKAAELYKEWPDLPSKNEKGKIPSRVIRISTTGFDSLDAYLTDSKHRGLTHLVIMENDKVKFLNDVFENEENYPFLSKIYDSDEFGLKNHVKIYQIEYTKFETLSK